jgi:transketolase
MIRTHLCYGRANVKLMGAYGGLSDSFDGPTHNSITDLAILRSLPHMTIVVPSDPIGVAKLLPQIADLEGPVYCRLNRNEVPVLFDTSYKPEIGKAVLVRPGSDVSIIAAGIMLPRSLEAADKLKASGISARVIEMHTIKPIDREAIARAAEETGAIVTAEEHSVVGGLGGAVAEVVSETKPVPVRRVGIQDRFAETGPYERVLDGYGMAVADIVSAAEAALAAKR